jgi:hypothetical protein
LTKTSRGQYNLIVITSKEILKKTGLKNIKTLTRWQQAGAIPQPFIGTHPSGRGKMAYWPDWVLDKCLQIRSQMKKGHTLGTAVASMEMSHVRKCIGSVDKSKLGKLLEAKRLTLSDGRKVSLAKVLGTIAASELKAFGIPVDQQRIVLSKILQENSMERAFRLLDLGCNPILLFDGNDLEVIPDFLTPHVLSDPSNKGRSNIVLPLFPVINRLLSALGRPMPLDRMTPPSNRAHVRQGDAIVEYKFIRVGRSGFELDRKGARTVGHVKSNKASDGQ